MLFVDRSSDQLSYDNVERRTKNGQRKLLAAFDRAGQTGQRAPLGSRSGIRRGVAGAGLEVQVLAAARAKSFAIFLAERPGGQGEKHLLAYDILKRKTALFIIADFGLVESNCSFSGLGVC